MKKTVLVLAACAAVALATTVGPASAGDVGDKLKKIAPCAVLPSLFNPACGMDIATHELPLTR
jgi:hypothetical protein